MIDWKEIANSHGWVLPKAMLCRFYYKEGMSISKLAALLGVSDHALRMKMIEYGFKMKPVGGRNNVKVSNSTT